MEAQDSQMAQYHKENYQFKSENVQLTKEMF